MKTSKQDKKKMIVPAGGPDDPAVLRARIEELEKANAAIANTPARALCIALIRAKRAEKGAGHA